MNAPSADETPDAGNQIARRLDALKSTSEPSAPKCPNDDTPNVPAQKLISVLARLNANQVNADKAAWQHQQNVESKMEGIRERMVSRDLLTAVVGAQGDAIATVGEQVKAMRDQQEETTDFLLKAVVVLAAMLLGLAVVVGIMAGGHR
ncbi:MAG: hypothetical protein JSS11_09030 [Verrucomicrobia bacterium]|nr:hypothetical protein [Verrucomicrobiota bacterium]